MYSPGVHPVSNTMNTQSNQNKGPAQRGPNKKQASKKNQKPRVQKKASPYSANKRVLAPVAKSQVATMSRQIVDRQPNGDCIIRHREFIQDLTGSVAFAVTTVPINPGLPGFFPWLSTIARSYESYRFEKLEFLYETEASTTSTGSVILAIDYDSEDAVPTTKTQVMSYRGAVRSAPWSESRHVSIREDLNKRTSYFVRSGALLSNQSLNLYDTGALYACKKGQADTSVIGELYVDYIIKLMTPQIGLVGVGEAIYGSFTGSVNSAPFATVTGNFPATVVSSGTTTSVNTWTFTQPWEGYINLSLTGTGLTGSAPSGTATSAEISEVINAGATASVGVYSVVAGASNTFLLTISNTTISASSALMGQADT